MDESERLYKRELLRHIVDAADPSPDRFIQLCLAGTIPRFLSREEYLKLKTCMEHGLSTVAESDRQQLETLLQFNRGIHEPHQAHQAHPENIFPASTDGIDDDDVKIALNINSAHPDGATPAQRGAIARQFYSEREDCKLLAAKALTRIRGHEHRKKNGKPSPRIVLPKRTQRTGVKK